MIDIVVTYLNDKDDTWREQFNYWKGRETSSGKADINNRQAFGEERLRDWGTFKYWFRGIEKNCPWVNKVFLIVQNENHIPKWLNRDNPKLRIVFHDEFIPNEILPVFNVVPILMYLDNIKDLGEYYIISDDDEFFLNPIKEDRFLRDNKPVHEDNRIPYEYYSGSQLETSDKVFFHILNNNLKLESKYMKEPVKYGFYHLPDIRKKSFNQKIMSENYEEILESQKVSKFRHPKNISATIFSDLLKICDIAYIDNNLYKNCSYCCLKSTVNFDLYKDKDIVCFNDTELLDNYNETNRKLVEFLDNKLPNKSSFEKE